MLNEDVFWLWHDEYEVRAQRSGLPVYGVVYPARDLVVGSFRVRGITHAVLKSANLFFQIGEHYKVAEIMLTFNPKLKYRTRGFVQH